MSAPTAAELCRERFPVGREESLTKTVTEADVVAFAGVSGDWNPVHVDAEYAARTRFGQRVMHGMFSAALISNVLGTRLPGPGAVYLGQTLRFRAPVFIGDTLKVTARVKAQRDDRPLLTIETIVTNQKGDVTTEGEATVLYEPLP
ncbi:MAG TPA: MaoC family dehydratase [Deinococcales bacterium]|nr:MaoC family dehydratase [Deinococcales bacterium]